MLKILAIIIFLSSFSGLGNADNYNAEDIKAFSQEKESEAALLQYQIKAQNAEIDALNEKIKNLNQQVDQLSAASKRQREVLDQWDSCSLCSSLCKDKIKDQVCAD